MLVGFPAFGLPEDRFFEVMRFFSEALIVDATAFGRQAGYPLPDPFVALFLPHGFPVDTSRQSSLNHFFRPPLYATTSSHPPSPYSA